MSTPDTRGTRAIPAVELLRLLEAIDGAENAIGILGKLVEETHDDAIETEFAIMSISTSAPTSFDFSSLQFVGSVSSIRSGNDQNEKTIEQITEHEWIGYFIYQEAVSILAPETKATVLAASEQKFAVRALEIAMPRLDINKDGQLTLRELYLTQDQVTDVLELNEDSNAPLTTEQLYRLLLANKIYFIPQTNEWRSIGKTPQRIAAWKAEEAEKQSKPAIEELIYRGKTLKEWMTQFQLERDPTELGVALDAILSLAEGEQEAVVDDFLIREMKVTPDRKVLSDIGHVSLAVPVFNRLMDPARDAKKAVQFVLDQLKTDDPKWIARVLEMTPGRLRSADEEALMPLIDWCSETFVKDDLPQEIYNATANCLYSLLFYRSLDDTADAIKKGIEFNRFQWLHYVEYLLSSKNNATAIELLEWSAVRTLTTNEADEKDIAGAALVLLLLNPNDSYQQDRFDRAGTPPITVTQELQQAIAFQLKRLIQSPEAMRGYVKTDLKAGIYGLPDVIQYLGKNHSKSVPGVNFLMNGSADKENINVVLPATLIRLAEGLNLQDELKQEILQVVQLTRDTAVRATADLLPYGYGQAFVRQDLATNALSIEQNLGANARLPVLTDFVASVNYWAALEALDEETQNAEVEKFVRAISSIWSPRIYETYDVNKDGVLVPEELKDFPKRSELTETLTMTPLLVSTKELEEKLVAYYYKEILKTLKN